MGDDALITATVVATIRFRNRVPYIENARGRENSSWGRQEAEIFVWE